MPVRWLREHKWITIAAVLIASVLIGVGVWLLLIGYIGPTDSAGRKDVVQAFALIIAGIVGAIGAGVGLFNARIARRNLAHNQEALRSQLDSQRELEDNRAQDAALQSYFEQMGDLLTNHDLISTDREDIWQLARAQTFAAMARLDGPRKGNLVRFLHGAGLIKTGQDKPILELTGADLNGADLRNADLRNAYLSDADLSNANVGGADLREASLVNADLNRISLNGADLFNAKLFNADLSGAHLDGVNLADATVYESQLDKCRSLADATMPDGQKYEDWLKANKKNSGST